MKLSKAALKKYADGTTYRSKGKTFKRVSFAGTPRGDNYCARSSGQKQTEKVRVRRKAWGCRGKKSIAGIGNPCWSGYEQFGMKTKKGKKVPNCVKITGLGGVPKKMDKAKNDLLKKVNVLIAKKKKLYSNVDIESPMSADEKKLNKDIADLFSQINKLIKQKRDLSKKLGSIYL